MALFSDLPRIWSREEINTSTQYIVEWTDGGPYVVFRNPRLVLDLDTATFGARVESRDVFINGAISQTLRAGANSYGEDFGDAGVVSSGLPAVYFDAGSGRLPSYAEFTEWFGVFSEDRSFSQSFTYLRGANQVLYTRANTTVGGYPGNTLESTGILHGSAIFQTDPQCIAFSPTNVWVFTHKDTVSPAVNSEVYLDVWNGTTVTSTQRLDLDGPILHYQIIRGTTGQVYLMYVKYGTGPGFGTGYIRAINESTRALSAILWSGPVGTSGFPDLAGYQDNICCNKVYTFGTTNYLVNLWNSVMTVHTYQTSTPNTLTLLCTGEFANTTAYMGKSAGVEYDPVSGDAHLVHWQIKDYFATGGEFSNQLTLVRQSHNIKLSTFTLVTANAQEIQGFVGIPSNPNFQILDEGQIQCYIPSNVGADRDAFLHFYCTERSGGQAVLLGFYVRLKNWNNPGPIDGAVDATITAVGATVLGAVDYGVGVEIMPEVGVTAAGVRPREFQMNTRWALQANANVDGEVLIDIPVEVEVSGATGDLEDSALEINPDLEVSIGSEIVRLRDGEVVIALDLLVDIQAESSPPMVEVFLNTTWLYTGMGFMAEFQNYMNEERATVFGLPPYKIMGTDAISRKFLELEDIASRHSRQMAFYRVFAHANSVFEPGWQTIEQRVGYLTNAGAENILFFANTEYGSGLTPLPTAYETYLSWKNSPPHYQNMTYNWGDDNDKVYSVFGYEFGLSMSNVDFSGFSGPPVDDTWEFFYATNNFLVLKETLMETSVAQYWAFRGLDGLFLPQFWNTNYYTPIKVEADYPYALAISTELDVPLNSVISVEHEHPWTSQVLSEIVHNWALASVKVQAEASYLYDLQRLPVSREIEHAYSVKVSLEIEFPYADSLKARSEIEIILSSLQSVAREQSMSLPLGPRVRVERDSPYELELRPQVAAEQTILYALESVSIGSAQLEVQLIARGISTRIQDGLISADASGSGFKFDCRLNSLENLQGLIGETIVIDFCGTAYTMIVTGLSASAAEGSVAPSYTLSAFSPVVLLDSPYAAQISYAPTGPTLFSDAVRDILGLPVTWEIVDWLVDPQRIQVSNSTPLAAARSLLESVGAILISLPSGVVKAVYRYASALDNLGAATPVASLVDDNQVFSINTRYEFNLGLNRFRIKDSDSAFGDQIEFKPDDDNAFSGIASVYISPARSSWRLRSTADTGVVVEDLGEIVDSLTETVEFRAGQAQTTRPIIGITSLSWLSTPLGGVSADPGSRNLTSLTTVNSGYGLITVTYTYRRHDFRVSAATTITATQLVVEEN